VDVTPEGKVRVLVSNTEFGQGTNTILTQIAAETLGIEYSDVTWPRRHRYGAEQRAYVASRTSMVVGRLIERACLQLISMLREQASLGATHTREEFFAACERYRAAHGEVSSMCRYEAPPESIGRSEISRRGLRRVCVGDYVAQVAWTL